MEDVANAFDISSADVWGTVSFYSFFNTKKPAKYTIKICKSISCSLQQKEEILSAITNKLKISVGETTPDNKFQLTQVNCLGWCHKAPAMLINDEIYGETNTAEGIKYFR